MPKKKKEPYANSSFDTDKAIAMRNDGATYKQIANAIGCSQSQAARICQYSGECKTAPRNRGFNFEREKLIGEWLKLARKGYSTYEIAAMYPDYSRFYIGNKLNGRGYRPGKGNGGAAKANAERSKKANLKQLLDAQEELGDRFIVCSIFKNSHALLICKECGYVFDRYLDPSVKEHRCPQCEAKRVEENKVKRETEHIEQLKRAQMQKLVNLLAYEHRCPQCGRAFRSSNPNKLYCSDTCRNRAKTSDHIKRARKHGAAYDRSITLNKLIERDGLTCYLCGKECDHNDKSYGSSGALHPSIEHVIPIDKGGTHTWDNVRVAHHRCNVIKGTKLLEECEPSMFEW